MLGMLTMLATPAAAQTFTILHNFTGGADGYAPDTGLTLGPSGVLYGTTFFGGPYDAGTVFKLKQVNSSWVLYPLYEFTGGGDGGLPYGEVAIGPNGALYGTASFGGRGEGVVFELRPPPTACASFLCYWKETVLHAFTGSPDGYDPSGNLAFDPAGDIYGTTTGGGTYDYGTVFELTLSGGGYTESIIHSFNYGVSGYSPQGGVVLDSAGNVYGTTVAGGTGTECQLSQYDSCGTVFQLVPSGGGWTANVLLNFTGFLRGNGENPTASPIIDASGNLYGTADLAYKLAPSGGGFLYSELNPVSYCGYPTGLTMDAAGNFYGACGSGPGADDYFGWVYELTNCSPPCTLIDLHDFGLSDGAVPIGTPVLDANGNLYGTTAQGGTESCHTGDGCGVIWEITP
jgi:hypothetical protein